MNDSHLGLPEWTDTVRMIKSSIGYFVLRWIVWPSSIKNMPEKCLERRPDSKTATPSSFLNCQWLPYSMQGHKKTFDPKKFFSFSLWFHFISFCISIRTKTKIIIYSNFWYCWGYISFLLLLLNNNIITTQYTADSLPYFLHFSLFKETKKP